MSTAVKTAEHDFLAILYQREASAHDLECLVLVEVDVRLGHRAARLKMQFVLGIAAARFAASPQEDEAFARSRSTPTCRRGI